MTAGLAVSWREALTDEPLDAAIALAALVGGTIVAAFVLRRLMRHARSLRHQVLAVTFVALAIGAIAAVLLARLMILDTAELARVAGVLGVTAVSRRCWWSSPRPRSGGTFAASKRPCDGSRAATAVCAPTSSAPTSSGTSHTRLTR